MLRIVCGKKKLNCGFFEEDVPEFIRNVHEGLGDGWTSSLTDTGNIWSFTHPEHECEYRVRLHDDKGDLIDRFGFESFDGDAVSISKWITAKKNLFERLRNSSLNSAKLNAADINSMGENEKDDLKFIIQRAVAEARNEMIAMGYPMDLFQVGKCTSSTYRKSSELPRRKKNQTDAEYEKAIKNHQANMRTQSESTGIVTIPLKYYPQVVEKYKPNVVVLKSALAVNRDNFQKNERGRDIRVPIYTFTPYWTTDARGVSDRKFGNRTGKSDLWKNSSLQPFEPKYSKGGIDISQQAVEYVANGLITAWEQTMNNPEPKFYESFVGDGLLDWKKDLGNKSNTGLINLVRSGAVKGKDMIASITSLPAERRKDITRTLLKENLVTSNQVLKIDPDMLSILVNNGDVPIDRAMVINPKMRGNFNRQRKLYEGFDDTENIDVNDVDSVVQAVADGTFTPGKAWRMNKNALKPMLQQKLITPEEAYRLDPTCVQWMLENHIIGRAEASKYKEPKRLKEEAKRKGIDWDSLDASRRSSNRNAWSSKHRR